jgi:hypothetical protein
VKDGRLIVDEPTDLPEGTVLDVILDDEGDDLTEEERELLHAEIDRSLDSPKKGRLRPAEDVLSDLDRGR